VLGLTVSQAAAEVLADEAQVRAENTAKWLYETRRGRWQLPDGALVLVDEASMVSTADLVEIVEQARRAGGKVLLVGDPAQLAAIHIGGAFDLLADRHGAARLREIRRFTEPGKPTPACSCAAATPPPGRVRDARPHPRRHHRRHRGEPVRRLARRRPRTATPATAQRADDRHHQRAGRRPVRTRPPRPARRRASSTDGPTVRLRDNVASVGDHIVTRRNDRRLRTSSRGWVVNGDVWTVIAVHPTAPRRPPARDGSTITLPADYLAEHTHLAYATTAHRAQGMTVDVCHAAITADTSHEQLYVAATRGRHGNHLWVIVDSDRDVVRDRDDLPAPEEILSRVLERATPTGCPPTRSSRTPARHHLAGTARGDLRGRRPHRHRPVAPPHPHRTTGWQQRSTIPQWPSLVSRVRETALAGHDVAALVEEAIRMRPIGDAHSTAAVLHWRLGVLGATPARPRGPLASLPPTDGPAIEVARQAGELMRQRWRDLRATLAATTDPLPWAEALGARPSTRPRSRPG
jgi:hypothetical protein